MHILNIQSCEGAGGGGSSGEDDYYALARKLMDQHGLQEWTINVDRCCQRAGLCIFDKKILSFSKYMLGGGYMTPRHMVINTILHEIAHALVGFAAGHGDVWKKKALEIGCDGDPYHHMMLKIPTAHISCPCGANKKDVFRLSRTVWDNRVCKKCGSKIQISLYNKKAKSLT